MARRAGVGAATVSRVLSGNGYVKSETRARIQQAIKELHYTPNEMARNLFYQKSGIVAVIVPELAHPFVADLVSAMEAALCKAGYQTMVCSTFYKKNYEQRYLDMLKRRMVDGIIFAAHTSLDVSQYQNLDLPIIGFDRILGPNIPCVPAVSPRRRFRPIRRWTVFSERTSLPWPASATRWSTENASPRI